MFFFSLVFLTIFIIFLLNKNYLQKSLYKIGALRDEADTKLTSIFKDIFNIFRYIKLNNAEKKVIENLDSYVKNANFYYGERYKKQQLIKYLTEFMSVSILLFMIFTLTYFDQKNYLQSLILGMVLFIRLVPSKNRLLSSIQSLNFSKKVVDRTIEGFIEASNVNKKEIDSNNELQLNEIRNLEIKDLQFSYNQNESSKILEDVNITILKGDKILIKGQSGSGKSTLIDLISGLLVPQRGEVLINNKNIKYFYNTFLSKISYLSQNSYFIDDTIRKNLELFQRKNINDNLIKSSLEITEANKFVQDLPNGLNTCLSMNAQQLSGGQKQRLALSRALLKEFDLLILDEATNALDDETETKVINKIIRNFNEKIIIFVSHSKKFENIADKVFEINDRSLNQIK